MSTKNNTEAAANQESEPVEPRLDTSPEMPSTSSDTPEAADENRNNSTDQYCQPNSESAAVVDDALSSDAMSTDKDNKDNESSSTEEAGENELSNFASTSTAMLKKSTIMDSGDESLASGSDEYQVKEIIDWRYNRKEKMAEYLIHWEGYDDPMENTWEPEKNLFCPEILEKFKLNHQVDEIIAKKYSKRGDGSKRKSTSRKASTSSRSDFSRRAPSVSTSQGSSYRNFSSDEDGKVDKAGIDKAKASKKITQKVPGRTASVRSNDSSSTASTGKQATTAPGKRNAKGQLDETFNGLNDNANGEYSGVTENVGGRTFSVKDDGRKRRLFNLNGDNQMHPEQNIDGKFTMNANGQAEKNQRPDEIQSDDSGESERVFEVEDELTDTPESYTVIGAVRKDDAIFYVVRHHDTNFESAVPSEEAKAKIAKNVINFYENRVQFASATP